jgi:hypothetical protein
MRVRERVRGPKARVLGARALAEEVVREGDGRRRLRVSRPETRADCEPGGRFAARPCPFVSCRHHLMLDPDGASIRFNFESLEEMDDTCLLDAVDRARERADDSPLFDRATGGLKVLHVSRLMNLAPERVREIEAAGLDLLKQAAARLRRSDEFEGD